jgi:tRNA uridine 5-carboxymethylaminomethyl modification enzyme
MADLTRDIVVVGAGHAGVEAALAASRMGLEVALVTSDVDAVCRMSCNPALGGLGKGHLVREIDAIGGQMGLCADATAIQFRRLNTRKGAAVRGSRVQSDKSAYSRQMAEVVRQQARLSILSGEVTEVLLEGARVVGVRVGADQRIACRAVVLTTGTFLAGLMHVGDRQTPGGRHGERSADALAQSLRAAGLPLLRLKTGTPARLDGNTLDFERMQLQPGDDPPPRMSYWSSWRDGKPPMPQVPCHITYTNARTHELIRDNLHRSAIYSGAISSTGPRYCPSIEDKIVRFADRDRHQIFVEPEGLQTDWFYPNGISTSLPAEVQLELVRSIEGFERAEVRRFGYAVEYDYCDPLQLEASLQVRGIAGLYFAGQINGTTGYEEAAAQGLMAGINASLSCSERDALRLRRDQAYIGVLIDDLVTRGVGGEPYRMFTSRAEYRLLLREDNAATRLTPLGRDLGLIDDSRWALFCERNARAGRLEQTLYDTRVQQRSPVQLWLERAGTAPARPGTSLAELLRRPEVTLNLLEQAGLVPRDLCDADAHDWRLALEHAEVNIKYAPYIERQREQAERLARLEDRQLPAQLDYGRIAGLSGELREKLQRQRPISLAQASRIPGMTPAAIALLDVHARAADLRTQQLVEAS